jgi:hypothetical protein
MPDEPKYSTDGVIRTPEDYTLMTWLNAERDFLDTRVEPKIPKQQPHPNEIATQKAVDDGIYAAKHVGVARKTPRKKL